MSDHEHDRRRDEDLGTDDTAGADRRSESPTRGAYEQLLERAATRGRVAGADAVLAGAQRDAALPEATADLLPLPLRSRRSASIVVGAAAALLVVLFGLTIVRTVDRAENHSLLAGPGSTAGDGSLPAVIDGSSTSTSSQTTGAVSSATCVPDPSVFPVDISAPVSATDIPPDQGMVMADQQIASSYGESHPDEFSGTVSLHQPERLAVAFTDHLDEHRAALLAIVPHPDRVLVVKGCAAEAELRRIQSDAVALASGRGVMSSGSSDAIGGFVSVALRADGEATARELVERYGDKVFVVVGTKPYPLGSAPRVGWYRTAPVGDPCQRTAVREAPNEGLEIVPEPESTTVRAGDEVRGTVRLTNHGSTPISLEGDQPVTGVIVERGTKDVVAVFTGSIAGTGWGATLAPGESAENTFLAATADCRADKGFALAPGEYGLVVPFGFGYDRKPEGGIDRIVIQWSTEVPITVVAN